MGDSTGKANNERRAFVFTLDALLVLPLIIIIISALIAFSSTLKENVLMHEYAYMIAKDSIDYMSELGVSQASPGLPAQNEAQLSVLEYVTKHLSDVDPANRRQAISAALDSVFPTFAGYTIEYKNGASWVEIDRGGNPSKLVAGNYSYQVSAVKVVSSLSEPIVAQGAPCSGNMTCMAPHSVYTAGEIVGPVMFRIRVFT